MILLSGKETNIMGNSNEQSVISVCGKSKIRISPDFIKINIDVYKISSTLDESQKSVNSIVKNILQILKEYGVDDINTHTIDFGQEYDYEDNKRVLLGQKVKQTISFIFYEIDENIEKVKFIMDKLSSITDDINLHFRFGVDNYEEKEADVRDLAYKNAFDKANQYAQISGLKIIKAIKISELKPSDISEHFWYSSVGRNDIDFTEIPIGMYELEVKLFCDFIAE